MFGEGKEERLLKEVIRRLDRIIELLTTTKPVKLTAHYQKGENYTMNQVVSVPIGANQVQLKAQDVNGNDITASCTFSAVSSDPTTILFGAAVAGTPNVFPFTALQANITGVTLTYTATDSAGNISEVDTCTVYVPVVGPASMTVAYEFGTVTSAAPAPPATT